MSEAAPGAPGLAEPTDALRVLFVAPAGVGGTIQYTHNLADALAEQGHRVVLATAMDFELAPFPRRYEVIQVFDRFTPHPRAILSFLRAARRLRPDVIHLQGAQRPEFYLLVWLILRTLTGADFVWTPQDVLSNSQKPYHRRLLRFLYARMRHVFLNAKQNEAEVRRLFDVPAGRITVLPMPDLVAFARRDLGEALPPELRLEPERPLILCFGLIEPRKGIGTLIEAFARLHRQGVDASLLVMGKALIDTGALREALANADLPGDRAQMIERYASFEEMNALFRRARMVVLPYHSGWNSGVLASAFGYGRPVIATTVGGFDEVVRDGENGLLVPPADPSALAGAIRRVLSDDALHDRLAAGAASTSKAGSWSAVAATTARRYPEHGETTT